ncbi:MAG: response regulator [Bdellovibrionota bacterium]
MAETNQNMDIPEMITGLCVLVVEDSEFDRALTIATLKKIGIGKIQVAENGRLAIAKIKNAIAVKKPFDIILLDAKMPTEDGMKVLGWIRGEPELKKQVVIMITATVSSEEVVKFIELGINGYVVKPLILGVLQSKIFEILNIPNKKKEQHVD